MLTAQARLVRHPLVPWPGPELSIAAACIVNDSGAGLCRFELVGELDAIVVPATGAPARVDGLWRHTCFELFVAQRGAAAYREFNFAPSGEWAAYAFADYRAPAPLPAVPAPVIRIEATGGRLALTALLGPGSWPAPEAGPLEAGLAAVLEARGGALGYFALGHPAERPDFHDRRAFALTLAPQAATA
jgi:GAF domain-containing protein